MGQEKEGHPNSLSSPEITGHRALGCYLLSAHNKLGLNGDHMGEGSRRPTDLEESWKVGRVGSSTEAGPHEPLPDTPQP